MTLQQIFHHPHTVVVGEALQRIYTKVTTPEPSLDDLVSRLMKLETDLDGNQGVSS